jgi:glycosyltransferase involved in cell wall biosynthesis
MMKQFKIVVPSFNSVRYLPRTLASIERQTYKNYQVCVIDDCSSFAKQRDIIGEYCYRNEWGYIFHGKNEGALASIIEGIRSFSCEDDDVIVLIDGDDWLYDAHVLEKLHAVYSAEDVYLTWGQFMTYPPHCIHMTYGAPIDQEIIKNKRYREIPDIFAHLKTFKYRLFREIKDEDLRDPKTGDYFRVSWDKALLYPMLEMANGKVRFIEDILYVYNIDNPLNDFKINREEQIEATTYIRSKPKYPSLFNKAI